MTSVIDQDQEKILKIRGLRVHFYTFEGVVKALDGITFDVFKGESLGLVGETGCGKSVTVRSIMRLIEEPGKIVEGEIDYHGKDILTMKDKEVRRIRGKKIAMIFQDPMTFLNPVLRVGDQVSEVFLLHQEIPEAKRSDGKIDKKKLKGLLRTKVTDIFKIVRLPDVEELYDRYPHELSGGMRQRVMIAMAIASNPDIMIADEATTALDVTIQAQILDLLNDLKDELRTTLIFVTHNLGIIANMCDRVIVLYGGQIVEVAETVELFQKSIHPYTRGLLKAIPLIHRPKRELDAISGVVPNLVTPPEGCRFHPRCYMAAENPEIKERLCVKERPDPYEYFPGHFVACHVRRLERVDEDAGLKPETVYEKIETQ
ncbi:MAG: ABC transporter ATP-binding protein [Candidatus Heimdallarchaeota archaeon]|nr:MAG: ABC transporter ATP-binding protein [Candidatus Heimdallarchaeota archaeon]